MNITERIQALSKEYSEQEKIKEDAHERMKEIKSKIGKLQTIAKHAEELFTEEIRATATQD
jgi:DNA-binding transcriptional regulator GbsR (MarR family)